MEHTKILITNLLANSHIESIPTHSDLSGWAKQGVLMLNSALFVIKSKPNSCQEMTNY